METVITMTTTTAKNLFRLTAILLFFAAALAPVSAQNSSNPRDEEYYDEEEEVEAKNPYSKFIGIGVTVGPNTIIEQQECPLGVRKSVSFDGIPSFGASLNYGLYDFLNLDVSYIYSKNTKENVTIYYADGNVHQFVNFSARFIANPRNRISFSALAGISVAFNRVFGINNQKVGINAGVGFEGHFPTSFGMLVPTAEWRLDFPFSGDVANAPGSEPNKGYCDGQLADTYTYYSIPRFTLYWYPKF
jgi:hypothetical protein